MNNKPATPDTTIPLCAGRRVKIWELEHRQHCTVIGTCLTLEELHRFCRKAGFKTGTPVSDYDLHIKLVSMIGNNPRASRPLNKYLDRKYGSSIHLFAQANSPHERAALWEKALAEGEVAGAYWALVTDPRTSRQLLFEVYGDVHMLSHLSGASVRLDRQALTRLRRRVPELERELADCRSGLLYRMREKERTIQTLNKRLAALSETGQKLKDAQHRLHALESGGTLGRLRTLLAEKNGELDKTRLRAERAEADARKWRTLAEESANRCLVLERQMTRSAAQRSTPETASNRRQAAPVCEDDNCRGRSSGLCKRCVLYVGGRNRQRARFRSLVERKNGRFIHHDGGQEESSHRLAELLPRADAVSCPLDCVSHDAVQRIVRHCKQHGKALKLLPKSSLAAFSRGLDELFAHE